MARMTFPWLVPDDPESLASLQRNAGLITHVSPTWYRMTGDLNVASRMTPDVAALARERGIAIHPLIVNEGFDADIAHRILATPESRRRAAEIIAALVFDGDYDGINMDFEGTFGRSRDNYTDLLRRLGELLRPRGKWLTVDVVSQTRPVGEYPVDGSWASPFDYAALGEICDRVMLMGYDYSMAEPGPVTPHWWLEYVIDWALKQMPAARIVVGLPFYARHWVISDEGISPPYGLKQDESIQFVAKSGRQAEYLPRDGTYRAVWSDGAGEHHVYYDNAETLEAKMNLVAKKGIEGVAFWRLGQESADVWKAVAGFLGEGAGQAAEARAVASGRRQE